MAQERQSLEESPIDRALSQTRGTFDPDQTTVTPDGLMGGHPAQEEDVEEDEVDGGLPPPVPVTPPAPVTPTPPPIDPAIETRRLESEQRMRLSMQEADALRADRDRLQREADALRKQITVPAETLSRTDTPDLKTARAQLRSKLQDISAVDVKLANYWDVLEENYVGMLDPYIQARASEVFQSLSPQQQTAMRQALLKDPEFLDAIKASVMPGVQTQVDAHAENTRVFNYVVAEAQKAGFDVRGEGQEADLFWNVAVGYADRTLPQGTTEERTTAALETMRRMTGANGTPARPVPPVTSPSRPVRQPMGRQSAGPAPTGGTAETPEQPISLEEAISQTHGKSRV